MRNTCINYLIHQASIDPNLYLIVGDVGFSVIEPFKERFGNRYINAGIAEQNMIGIAAGLAMAGKNVYVYSIIPFLTMRCFEQIRNDICYQNLSIKLIGIGGGLSYATMGSTHHGLEDVSIMRSLPGMTVVAPGSVHETKYIMESFNALKGPAYLKCSTVEELATYPNDAKIMVGKAISVVDNKEIIIITTGNALDLGWQVHQFLINNFGISVGLVSMPTVKPLDTNFLKQGIWHSIFTIEEQFIIGGLGEAVASFLSQHYQRMFKFQSFGIDDVYFHQAGSRKYLQTTVGLKADVIAEKIRLKLMQNIKPLHMPIFYEKQLS